MFSPETISKKIGEALTYWESKRSGRRMPARADIDPGEIRLLLPHVILLDVAHDPLDFRYRLIGTVIEEHLLTALSAKWMSAIPHQRSPSRIWSNCRTVVETRMPLQSDTPYVGCKRDFVVSQDILMPLSDNDSDVTMLFVIVDYLCKDALSSAP